MFSYDEIVPGMSSILWSLYLIPKEYADEDWITFFSDFSTSYDPGAVKVLIEKYIVKKGLHSWGMKN